jgi:hypothetical protein
MIYAKLTDISFLEGQNSVSFFWGNCFMRAKGGEYLKVEGGFNQAILKRTRVGG